jgi:hypothetical protein
MFIIFKSVIKFSIFSKWGKWGFVVKTSGEIVQIILATLVSCIITHYVVHSYYFTCLRKNGYLDGIDVVSKPVV